MFKSVFIVFGVFSVTCKNFDYASQSLEDQVMYYDEDVSQDSTDGSTAPALEPALHQDYITTEEVATHSSSIPTWPSSQETTSDTTSTARTLPHRGYQHHIDFNNFTLEPTFNTYQEPTRYEETTEDEDLQTLVNYPYVASISRRGSHYATAALVDKRWLISVASEFFNVRESIKQFSVLLGSINCKKGDTIPLKKIEIHPSYRAGRPAYDISLLRMAWPAQFSPVIKPIPISTVDSQVASAKYLTAYWPRIIINNRVLPPTAPERKHYNSLRVSTQTLIPLPTCTDLMRNTNETLDQSLLCLNPVTEFHTKCTPDPGAPVVAEEALWGVTSGWRPRRCRAAPRRSPTLFTRVGLYSVRLWIDTVILL